MFYRAILSRWEVDAIDRDPTKERSLGDFDLTQEQIETLNDLNYNIYFFPNYPSNPPEKFFEAGDIDTFNYVFVDMDLKDYQHKNPRRAHNYKTKEDFYQALAEFELQPSSVIDSGNGVHAYWKVNDLDAMSFLRLQRRLCRHLHTDDAVAKLNQLMRVPGTLNTKSGPDKSKWTRCELIDSNENEYSCEQLDRVLDKITIEDEEYCRRTYDSAFNPTQVAKEIEELPKRWFAFAKKGSEAYRLFYGNPKDRSTADFRLAHLMLADGFSRDEALAVLANTAKASERSSTHRFNYANNILDKMWKAIENQGPESKFGYTVEELLEDDEEEFDGTPFRCHEYFDATVCGFRLGHVLGLVGGPGSGKTATSMNIFFHFAKSNPQYYHVIFTLEQPKKEIAKRWKKICGGNKALYKNVIIVDNYNADGTHRMLSLADCEEYVKKLQDDGFLIGAVMIDHIGILRQEAGKKSEREALVDICQQMKAVAVNRNIMLIMQSQTSREKAKGGDIELNQDAAYGTTNFEWFVDWLITIWQPLRRIYKEAPHMSVTCFKYCKIRHKHPEDNLKENVVYALMFQPATEQLRRLNEEEKESYDFWARRAATERNRDRSTDPGGVEDVTWAATPRSGDAP